ncbi:unnamed protein product [Coregonus sp. 'balchen']|nr:unnamed protein product [Coregonus sp. 'balchen']
MAEGTVEQVTNGEQEEAYFYRERIKCTPEEETRLERQHFWKVIDAFRYYRMHVQERVNRAERQFRSLPEHHQLLLPGVLPNLARIRRSVDHNQEVLQAIVLNCVHMFENMEYGEEDDLRKVGTSSTFDMDKLKSTIKQFVRDWSEAGQAERDSCYLPLIQEIQRLFPSNKCDVSKVSVLVPGAGLGRLACEKVNSMTLYPWIHQFSNNKRSSDQTRPISFPDVNPQSLPPNSDFSMVAGDFQEVYTEPNTWDCVATCFFIDTAHNVIDYVETIWNILKPGGNMANELSIELSYEDVREAILKYGFHLEVERESVPTTYTENDQSMLKYLYDCVFFVARKPDHLYANGFQVVHENRLEASPRRESCDSLT